MQFKNPLVAVAAALEAAAFSLRSSCAEETTNAVDLDPADGLQLDPPAIGTPTADVGAPTASIVEESASVAGDDSSNVVELPAAAVVEDKPDTRFDTVIEMLEAPDYTLRTTTSLVDKSGMTRDEIIDALEDRGIDYVILRRRRDGAELIGLDSRN